MKFSQLALLGSFENVAAAAVTASTSAWVCSPQDLFKHPDCGSGESSSLLHPKENSRAEHAIILSNSILFIFSIVLVIKDY
ncbi:Putative protein [Zobellia galactanivorans]|uniref:Uncharacterized protein n=1 Tax=Zobellia galactanivorans (strain DSM 12802 / CCUG 47099 / CIP 106680 / NCIMB 13871 / Dsij) TaxID=63186 RepID=G0L7G1_ZOBGA|nr:Putative protein [Zobellia galactanivorans]